MYFSVTKRVPLHSRQQLIELIGKCYTKQNKPSQRWTLEKNRATKYVGGLAGCAVIGPACEFRGKKVTAEDPEDHGNWLLKSGDEMLIGKQKLFGSPVSGLSPSQGYWPILRESTMREKE